MPTAPNISSPICGGLPNRTRGASAHRGNVASAADCRRTIAEVIEAHGRLDVLVHNAGITMDRTVAEMTEEQWEHEPHRTMVRRRTWDR
ncbi:SDR family NAD(P)-dependent oxidoreductase [Nocardia vinacea]|uniref:SDR family NAD(P)-dependent oxidoreductase n=1 Tax=Nocardia vinacea TaxID=96468 RepID=UPI0033CC3471